MKIIFSAGILLTMLLWRGIILMEPLKMCKYGTQLWLGPKLNQTFTKIFPQNFLSDWCHIRPPQIDIIFLHLRVCSYHYTHWCRFFSQAFLVYFKPMQNTSWSLDILTPLLCSGNRRKRCSKARHSIQLIVLYKFTLLCFYCCTARFSDAQRTWAPKTAIKPGNRCTNETVAKNDSLQW